MITKICKANNIPVYSYTHGVRSGERMRSQSYVKKLLWWWLIDRKMFSDVSGIVAITKNEKEELMSLNTTQNICVIPNGVDIPLILPNSREIIFSELGIQSDEKFIFFLGRTEPIKGVDLLIDSFAISLSHGNANSKLVISGPDRNNYRATLEAQAERLGISDRVIFTGSIAGDLKTALFQECDGFALLSITEVLAMSALEAMKFQKPVVVTDTQAFSEFLNRDMMIGADRDCEQIGAILSDFLSRTAASQQMARRAKFCIDTEYDWKTIAQQTVQELT